MENTNLLNISKLFENLKLGAVIEEPIIIMGGLLNQMYKVKTETSVFAVKLLNPLIMKRETALGNYILSEKFARHAFANGIDAIPAIQIDQKVVHQYENQNFLIFPWVEGESGEKMKMEIIMCSKMGKLLATIHGLNFNNVKQDTTYQETIKWNSLISMAKKCNSIWFDNFNSQIELIKGIEEKTNLALLDNKNNIFSHRDLGPKNTMWDVNMNPIVIDWEASGAINMNVELLEVALYWSDGGKNKEAFQSVIQSYQNIRNIDLSTLKSSLYCIYDSKLKWLEYNIKRSLGIESSNEEEQLLGSKEVISTLKSIVEYVNNISDVESYIKELI